MASRYVLPCLVSRLADAARSDIRRHPRSTTATLAPVSLTHIPETETDTTRSDPLALHQVLPVRRVAVALDIPTVVEALVAVTLE